MVMQEPANRDAPAVRGKHRRILSYYQKRYHPLWLESVDLYQELADDVERGWRKKKSRPYRIWHDLLWAWRLFHLSRNYEVVLTGCDGVGLLLGVAQKIFRRNRVPQIYLDFLVNFSQSQRAGALRKTLYRCAVQGASCALVQRTCEVEAYAQTLGLEKSKFCFVPYHSTLLDSAIAIRDDRYIFAGGDSDRDYPLLIEAVRDLPYRVTIAAWQRDHFAQVSIPQNVEVVRVAESEFLKLMAHAAMVIVPLKSLPQHVGGEQTYLNAMTMGKLVIVTDQDASDYIENGKSGILTPAGDSVALREAIVRAMEDSDLAQAIGQRARLRSMDFTPENFFLAVFTLCDKYASCDARAAERLPEQAR